MKIGIIGLFILHSLHAHSVDCHYEQNLKEFMDCHCKNANTTIEVNTCMFRVYDTLKSIHSQLTRDILKNELTNEKHIKSFKELEKSWSTYIDFSGEEAYASLENGSGRNIGLLSRKIDLLMLSIDRRRNYLHNPKIIAKYDNIQHYLGDWINPSKLNETLSLKKIDNKLFCNLRLTHIRVSGACNYDGIFLNIKKHSEWLRLRNIKSYLGNYIQIINFPIGSGETSSRVMLRK